MPKLDSQRQWTIYMTYSEYSETISDATTDDDPWGFVESKNHFAPLKLYRSYDTTSKGLYEQITIDFDPADVSEVFIVIVRYTDGGTFGSTSGYWKVMNVFKNKWEAELLQKSIQSREYEKNAPGWVCWTGYFCGLDDVELHQMAFSDK